jgi:hypothetical protein
VFYVPNLDDITTDPKEMAEVADVLAKLSLYASKKAKAMQFRAAGAIANAVVEEHSMEAVYQTLPRWAKW